VAGAGAAGDPEEIELKYRVKDVEALRAWLESGLPDGITSGEWRERLDRDTYVDTADGAIARGGFGARLRRRGGRVTLTLKSPDRRHTGAQSGGDSGGNAGAALHQRTELEGRAGAGLDPLTWPESAARERLLGLVGDAPLAVRFTIRQRRRVRLLHREDGAAAELSLDEVEVRVGRRTAGTFSELEVEAVGDPALLEAVAAALAGTSLVEPEPRSKETVAAEMVQAMASAEAGRSAFAALPKNPGVLPDDTLGAAGRKVLRLHLARMLALEAGTRSGDNPEDLHKMRVATRRMRAAWRVFDGAYKPKVQKRYVAELREVATALGAVRDLDVQLEGLEAHQRTLSASGSEALAPLADEWRLKRESARSALMKLLDSNAYAKFVADYRDFADRLGAAELNPLPNQPSLVRESAGSRIWTAFEHVRAHDATLQWADAIGLHALRIDAKRLRYALEFFREALPRTHTDRLIAAVTALQDHLGELNDADVAIHTAREFLVAHGSRLPAQSREAIGHLIDAREADIARLRRTLPPIWRRVSGPTFRRSLGSAIASL
jgi:CHAD domain-containing protein